MQRSWLIGAALVFALTAVGCKDDDEDPDTTPVGDSGTPRDGGPVVTPGNDAGPVGGGGMDAGNDAGSIDARVPDATTPPADAAPAADSSTTTAVGLDAAR